MKSYDGYRIQLVIDGGASEPSLVVAQTGRTSAPIVEAAASLPTKSAIIDGEMIAPDVSGAPDFLAFRKSIKRWPKLALVAFDLLPRDGKNLRPLPEIERRELLRKLVAPADGGQFSQHEVAAYPTASRWTVRPI